MRFWSRGVKLGNPVPRTSNAAGQASFVITFPLAGPIGVVRANYLAVVSGHDRHGVTWVGEAKGGCVARGRLVAIDAKPLAVVLQRGLADVSHLKVGARVRGQLVTHELGNLILDDLLELNESLRLSLPVSSLSLTGKILDGFLKFKGQEEGWWVDTLDDLPLGTLLNADPVKQAIRSHLPPGEIDRLRGSAVWTRNVAAHQKYAPVSIQDALASAGVVLAAIEGWR